MTAQADYSWELAGLFSHTERDAELRRPAEDVDSDLFSITATRYFSPIREGDAPPALHAFFDPSSELTVGVGDTQTTRRFFSGPNALRTTATDEDVSDYSLSGRYLLNESKWYAGGRYAQRDGDSRSTSRSLVDTGSGFGSTRVEEYAVFAGKYFGATRLELSFERWTEEFASSSTFCSYSGFCSTSTLSGDTDFDGPTLAVMHVRRSRTMTYALLGELSETRERLPDSLPAGFDLDRPRSYFVGAELYPKPTVGVRLGYRTVDAPAADESAFTVGANWFVRRNVGLDLALSRATTDIDSSFGDAPPTHRLALRVFGRL